MNENRQNCESLHQNMFRFMVFNATFNNISVISWPSALLVEETRENHRPVASHWQALSQNVVLSTPRDEQTSDTSEYEFNSRENEVIKNSVNGAW